MRTPIPLILALSLGATGGAAADALPFRSAHGEGAALARLVLPDAGGASAPLVLLLPDANGEQGRAAPYVDALIAHGLASLVLGSDDGTEAHETEAAPATAEGHVPADAAIGFGAGARAALSAVAGPVVALDPGCIGLQLPPGRQVLLVHGLAAPDAPDCIRLDRVPGVTRFGLPGIGHGWDLPVVLAPAGALLPDPSGPGRRRARPDPVAAEAVAAGIAAWLAMRLGGDMR